MQKKTYIIAGIAFALIGLGVILNEWVIAYFFTYDSELVMTGRVLVWVMDALLVGAGTLIFIKRRELATNLSFSRTSLLIGCIIVLGILGALEVSARIIDRAYDGKFTAITVENRKQRGEGDITPFRIFGPTFYQTIGDDRLIVDSHGETFPFTKDNDTIRIVAFGGSTTWQAVDGVHYPKRLAALLAAQTDQDVEVINVAFSAYATPHSLIILNNDVLSWDPDIVILSHNINDLTAAYFPNFTPDYANKYGHEFYTKPCRVNLCLSQKLFEWSTLYWLMDQQIQAFRYRQVVGEDYYQRKSYGNEPPEAARSAFMRNLTTFVRTAKHAGITIVLGTQPYKDDFRSFDLHTRAKPYNDVVIYPLHEELGVHHAAYNDIIRDVASREGALLVDNARDFEGKGERFSDFVHYTRAGIEQLAENYARTIAPLVR